MATLVPWLTLLALACRSVLALDVLQLDWHVTVGVGAPDCFQRNLILVNGTFQPTIEVVQGALLQITVHNDLPADFPDNAGGLSLHWHGFNMRGREWYDGTAYAAQCPIAKGTSFTYSFEVNEQVGSYLWHDHSQLYRADGLQGALIVLPRPGTSEGFTFDADQTLFVSDWFHGEATALAMDLQRPFDLNKTTPTSGHWRWVGLPQALLVNGQGFYGDCALVGGLGDVAGTATKPTTCNVSTYTVAGGRSVQQPWASSNNPGCGHTNVTVTPGSTTRLRLISSAILAYMTVCFESHNVTLIAADAVPVQPISFGNCVDIASGQRADVLLTADQPASNYWISFTTQYRLGAPMGFAVLHYEGAANATLPTTSTPQPTDVLPFTMDDWNEIVINDALLESNPESEQSRALYANAIFPGNETTAQVPAESTQEVVMHVSQPLLESTGQIRWALNNIAQPEAPPCRPVLEEVYNDTSFLQQHAAATGFSGNSLAGVQEGNGADLKVFMANEPQPEFPSTGLHALEVSRGEVIDIIIQNTPGSAFNGDYRGPSFAASRVAEEHHSFHLHGHHFWLLATGLGTWNASSSPVEYNLDNPAQRDTLVLLPNGWAAIRFVADNPGVWILHCHLTVHFVIGQALYIVEDKTAISAPPPGMPQCPSTCGYSYGLLNQTIVAERYGNSGFETPDEVVIG